MSSQDPPPTPQKQQQQVVVTIVLIAAGLLVAGCVLCLAGGLLFVATYDPPGPETRAEADQLWSEFLAATPRPATTQTLTIKVIVDDEFRTRPDWVHAARQIVSGADEIYARSFATSLDVTVVEPFETNDDQRDLMRLWDDALAHVDDTADLGRRAGADPDARIPISRPPPD